MNASKPHRVIAVPVRRCSCAKCGRKFAGDRDLDQHQDSKHGSQRRISVDVLTRRDNAKRFQRPS